MGARFKFHKSKAQAIIELCLLAVLFVVIATFSLDVGFIVLGAQVNDAACRDAARAAAQGDSYANALALASAAVATHHTDGYFVSQPAIDTADFQYEDFSGLPPANTSPFVRVSTTANVRVPAPIYFLGQTFGAGGTMQFRRTYFFPIVRTRLYL